MACSRVKDEMSSTERRNGSDTIPFTAVAILATFSLLGGASKLEFVRCRAWLDNEDVRVGKFSKVGCEGQKRHAETSGQE
jgi:hypothetical protein